MTTYEKLKAYTENRKKQNTITGQGFTPAKPTDVTPTFTTAWAQAAKNAQGQRALTDAQAKATINAKIANALTPDQRIANAIGSGIVKGVGGTLNAAKTAIEWLGDKYIKVNNAEEMFALPPMQNLLKKVDSTAGAVSGKVIDAGDSLQNRAEYGASNAGKFALQGVNSIANMGTSAALGAATGLGFTPMMGIQAGGNSAYEADKQGKTLDQQMAYGVATGVSSALIESIGGIGGKFIPKGAAGNITGKILSKLPAPIAQWANSTGSKIIGKFIANGVSEAGEEFADYSTDVLLRNLILQNDTPYDIKQAAYQALQGGTVGALVGGGMSSLNVDSAAPKSTGQDAQTTPPAAPSTTPQNAPQAPQSVTPIQTTVQQKTNLQANVQPQTSNPALPEGMGAASQGIDKTAALVNQYGAIKPGENPVSPDRIVELPKKTSENLNVMQTMRTIMEAPVVTNGTAEVIEKMVVDEKFSREVNTDKGALQRAKDTIMDKGYQQSLSDFTKSMNKGVVTKDSVALGFTLLTAAESVGDSKTSVDIITDMVDNVRNAAQVIQAVRLLKKMQPEYQLYAIQRSVNNLKAELQQKYGDKAPNLQIDNGLAQAYLDALFLKDDIKAKAALDDIHRYIASQVPATFADKWNAWRYTAMLFNPVTHIKNIVGNYVFRGERFIKNVLSATAQTIGKKLGGEFEQTRAFLTKKDAPLIREAQNYYNEDVETILRYGKYDDATNKINEYRKIYGTGGKTAVGNAISKTVGKVAEGARQFNTSALETEDNWVSRPAYINSLASYLKANKVNFQTANPDLLLRARAFAILEAQKSSYRDSNAFSDFVSNSTRYRGKNVVGKAWNVVSEGVLPFRRTPANILVRGLEYSPLGLAKSATVDVGKLIISKKLPDLAKKLHVGEITVPELMDNLSEGLTGTAITALGMLLASMGLITVGSTGDDKQDKFDQTQGKQQFALTIGNTSYTIDWLAPAAMPLFVGVSIYNKLTDKSENGITYKDAQKIAMDITDPLLETSMLQSLNDYLEGFGYAKQQDENLLWYGLSQAAMSYLGQSVPTLFGRINRTIDPTRRTVFTDPQSGVPTDIQYFIGQQMNKIPGASTTNQPYIDQWGNQQKTDAGTRFIQNWLSPGFIKDVKTSPMEKELQRLFDSYGKENEVNVLPPASIKKYFSNNGEEVYMNAQEYTQYKTTYGQYAYKELTKLTASQAYKKMSDADKAEAVSNVYSQAAENAKTQVMKSRGEMRIPTAQDGVKIQSYVELGITEKQAYSLNQSIKALDDPEISDKVSVILSQKYNAQQSAALIGTLYTSHDQETGEIKDESLLPTLKYADHLLSLYSMTKDTGYINMAIPYSITSNKEELVLTPAERELYKKTFLDYYNRNVTNLKTKEAILAYIKGAKDYARSTVLESRAG